MEKARFFRNEAEGVRCLLCPHCCFLKPQEKGLCGVRGNQDGVIFSLNYGFCAAIAVDPMEKKPLYHFLSGRPVLSLGTSGCNLACSFCQNWQLARAEVSSPAQSMTPGDILAFLNSNGGAEKIPAVAYTYNEPITWFEFVFDTASLLSNHGYKNVLVTNGYINREPLEILLPFIDAMNIDLKSFSDNFYRRHCKGTLAPVKASIERAHRDCHVEITTLLIPTLNDELREIENLSSWLGGLDRQIPLHFSRYFPQREMELPPTPPHVMRQAREVARRYLDYVYLGNIDLPHGSDTFCPRCENLLISRNAYRVNNRGLTDGHCQNCGFKIMLGD